MKSQKIYDTIQGIRYSGKLANPAWLQQRHIYEGRSVEDIAKELNVSTEFIEKKINAFGLNAKDAIVGVYTGRWHSLAKKGAMRIMKPAIKQIEETTEEVYCRTTSRNSALFKHILVELGDIDKDTGESSGRIFGKTRKQFYILMMKFMICLYEYDTYYAERMEYVLHRILQNQENIYISKEMSDPDNWYPNRSHEVLLRYMQFRITGAQSEIKEVKGDENERR